MIEKQVPALIIITILVHVKKVVVVKIKTVKSEYALALLVVSVIIVVGSRPEYGTAIATSWCTNPANPTATTTATIHSRCRCRHHRRRRSRTGGKFAVGCFVPTYPRVVVVVVIVVVDGIVIGGAAAPAPHHHRHHRRRGQIVMVVAATIKEAVIVHIVVAAVNVVVVLVRGWHDGH